MLRIVNTNNNNVNYADRTCDKCGRKYIINKRTIPRIRISICKDVSDLNSYESFINPDYCSSCMHNIVNVLGDRILYKMRNQWNYFGS